MFANWEETVRQIATSYGPRLIGALVIFTVGYVVVRLVTSSFKKILARGKLDVMLESFVANLVHWILVALIIVLTLDQLGVDTTALSAGVAGAGVTAGLAFKDTLANMIAGFTIIMRDLFTVGDFVEVGGKSGTVETVTIFATVLRTPDNRLITVSNSAVVGASITNYSAKPTRRIDLVVGIGYQDDIDLAKRVLGEILAADTRVLKEPEPTIAVSELGDSSVDLVVRPWVQREDYGPTRCDLIEQIKLRCDKERISIPYPQRDVHLRNTPAADAA